MSFLEEYVAYLKDLSTVNPRSYLKVSLSDQSDDVIYFYDGLSTRTTDHDKESLKLVDDLGKLTTKTD